MGQVTFLKNTTGFMIPEVDFIDTGWSIGAGIASHMPCNAGKMTNVNVKGLIVGHTYNVTYDVLNYVNNSVYFSMGTTDGTPQTGNVTEFTEDLLCAGNTDISFFSDGRLSIANLVVYDLVQPSVPLTVSFNEEAKLWSGTQSMVPDTMLRYSDDLFSWKDGQLWKHNDNPIRGNYYGVQYPTKITFYVNSDPRSVKIFSGIIIESNKPWWVPKITIKPYTGKSLGMESRIKLGKVKQLQGVFYADFLRNMLDPRFGTQLDALLKGEELRGQVMQITIQNDDTEEVILYKVQVKYTTQMLTP